MRKDLGVTIRFAGSLSGNFDVTTNFKITGEQLMQWLKSKADAKGAETGVPAQAGTDADPWVLGNYDQFVDAWTTLRRDANWKAQTCYFKIGGRKICKFPADEKHGGLAGGHAEGFYMADVALSGHGTGQDVWKKADGASYADFAKTFQVNMMASTKHSHDEAGYKEWSVAKAQKLRLVLTGGRDFSAKGADSTSGALPLLAAVMFIAEPARNPRTFPLGLMLLDMIGGSYNVGGTKYYILDRVLAHPDRVAGNAVPSKPQLGPTSRDWAAKGGATVGLGTINMTPGTRTEKADVKSKLAQVEGKWSASPSGSARTQDLIDIAEDYIQMKELSILARWVAKMLEPSAGKASQMLTITALRHDDTAARPELFATASIQPYLPATMDSTQKGLYDQVFTGLKTELQNKIPQLIQERISSFRPMP